MEPNQCSAHTLEQGKIVGQKAPLKLKEVWAVRIRLSDEGDSREAPLPPQCPLRVEHCRTDTSAHGQRRTRDIDLN